MPLTPNFQDRLSGAQARIQYGNAERTAGADDKARVIAEEVTRRGRGGTQQLAAELGVSPNTITEAVTRGRATELATLTPLPSRQWIVMAYLVRSTVIDKSWYEQPGECLAQEVEDCEDLDDDVARRALVKECRGWSVGQALAVINACQRGALDALPRAESE